MDRRANPRLYDEIQDTDNLSLVSHFNFYNLRSDDVIPNWRDRCYLNCQV